MPLFNSNIDLDKNELQNAVIQVSSSKPSSPATGQIFYDSDVSQIQVYNGSIWQGLATEIVDTDNIFNTALKVGRDEDNLIDFTVDNQITVRVSAGNGIVFKASGEIEAASLDINGNADISGDLTGLDNITSTNYVVGGHTIDDIDITAEFVDADAHIMSSKAIGARFALKNADTTGNAATVTVTSGTANSNHAIAFTDGTGAGTSILMDTGLLYNPSTNRLIATLQTASQPSITGVGTISTGVWNGTVIASAKLDADTAHLTTAQTFTGAKTFGTTNKLLFRDAAIYLNSSTDGQLDIVADNEIQIAATTIDINGAVVASGDIQATSLDINGNADIGGNLTGLDNVTSTNYVIGGHTVNDIDIGTEFVDADDHVMSSKAIVAKFGLKAGSSSVVTTGALNSGSITSGFGTIDTGASAITTTGLISGGSLDIDNVLINGANIGHTDDTDLIALADGAVTVNGSLTVTGTTTTNNVETVSTSSGVIFEGTAADGHDATLVSVVATSDKTYTLPNATGHVALFAANPGTTTVSATPAEINLIDGNTARGTTAVAAGDGILTNDGGTMRMTNVQTFATYFTAFAAAANEKTFILNATQAGVASSDNITYTVTHGLSTRNVMVEVIRNGANSGDYATVYTDIKRTTDDIITVVFGSARTAGNYTVMIRKNN
jgi:hypothetical protein